MMMKPPRQFEWLAVLFASGAGFSWGIVSLWIYSGWLYRAGGLAREVALRTVCLPTYLAFWLDTLLRLAVTDPSLLVLATGTVLGLLVAAALIGVDRLRRLAV
jgi:hypothetical protein